MCVDVGFTLCGLVGRYQRFEGRYCFHLQGFTAMKISNLIWEDNHESWKISRWTGGCLGGTIHVFRIRTTFDPDTGCTHGRAGCRRNRGLWNSTCCDSSEQEIPLHAFVASVVYISIWRKTMQNVSIGWAFGVICRQHSKFQWYLCVPHDLIFSNSAFCSQTLCTGFIWFFRVTSDYLLKDVNQLNFVMEAGWLLFEVRTEFSNRLLSRRISGFKGLKRRLCVISEYVYVLFTLLKMWFATGC
jgi:hypothetical protein